MKDIGVHFHEGIPESDHLKPWFPKGGLVVLEDLMAEWGEDKELLNLFTKHSYHHRVVLVPKHAPAGKCSKSISRNTHYILVFKNPRAFPTYWQEMTEQTFRYMVLVLHPASDEQTREFSHLLMHKDSNVDIEERKKMFHHCRKMV